MVNSATRNVYKGARGGLYYKRNGCKVYLTKSQRSRVRGNQIQMKKRVMKTKCVKRNGKAVRRVRKRYRSTNHK